MTAIPDEHARDESGRDEADERPEARTATAPEVDKLKTERDDLLAQLARARADYQNLRKRTQVDVDNSVRRALEGLLQGLFLVVDHLDLALSTPAKSDDGQALSRGVEMTREQLLRTLAQEGAQPIPETREFDPNLHEAVATVPTGEHPPGSVVAILRRGWTWRGQVLRAAHVQVAVAPNQGAGDRTS
jgi:molecular chaperone GrpE